MRKKLAAIIGAATAVAGVLVMRKTVSTLVQLTGIGCLSAGGFAYDATWGFLLLGAGLILFGVAMELD